MAGRAGEPRPTNTARSARTRITCRKCPHAAVANGENRGAVAGPGRAEAKSRQRDSGFAAGPSPPFLPANYCPASPNAERPAPPRPAHELQARPDREQRKPGRGAVPAPRKSSGKATERATEATIHGREMVGDEGRPSLGTGAGPAVVRAEGRSSRSRSPPASEKDPRRRPRPIAREIHEAENDVAAPSALGRQPPPRESGDRRDDGDRATGRSPFTGPTSSEAIR